MPFIIILLVVAVLGAWVISNYNFFVSTKTRIGASIQEIGNQLKRQSELIPNLESSVKGYLKHEKTIFKELTDARKMVVEAAKSGNVDKMSDAGEAFAKVLPKLQVIVESNPQLKSADVVKDLMNELRDTSDKVMYARRLLIDLSADYNVRRVSFPSNMIANIFGFTEMQGLKTDNSGEFLNVAESDTKTPKVEI